MEEALEQDNTDGSRLFAHLDVEINVRGSDMLMQVLNKKENPLKTGVILRMSFVACAELYSRNERILIKFDVIMLWQYLWILFFRKLKMKG